MHSYRLHLAVAVLVTLLSLGGAVAALHSISEGSNSDPTSKMFEDLNAALSGTGGYGRGSALPSSQLKRQTVCPCGCPSMG